MLNETNAFPTANISQEELLQAYKEISNVDSNELLRQLEDAIGTLNYVEMNEKPVLMSYNEKAIANPSAIQFGLHPTSNTFIEFFERIKQWICAHSTEIKKITDDVNAKKEDINKLIDYIKTAVTGVVAFISTITPVVKIIVIVVQLLIKYGIPALCPSPPQA